MGLKNVGGVSHPDSRRSHVGGVLHPDSARPSGYSALRKFRESKQEADYFLTVNLAKRGRGLENPVLTVAVIDQWTRLETEGKWVVRSGTVMPDHLHLLVRLNQDSSLESCLKALKGRLSPGLRATALKWQDGFYERQLRRREDILPVFLYIYLNPYRAGLLAETETWPGYRCCPEDWKWFAPLTKKSCPQPEWLR